jgi:hypothetical protein
MNLRYAVDRCMDVCLHGCMYVGNEMYCDETTNATNIPFGSWGKPWWNPCHSLIFDYLSISTEGKTANPGDLSFEIEFSLETITVLR